MKYLLAFVAGWAARGLFPEQKYHWYIKQYIAHGKDSWNERLLNWIL